MSTPRASFERLQEFANEVRKAGGGNPIDAIAPAVPEDSSKCLVARNLNFNCSVLGMPYRYTSDRIDEISDEDWVMYAPRKVVDVVSEALNLPKIEVPQAHRETRYASGVILPDEIGQVASDFDEAQRVAYNITMAKEYGRPVRVTDEEKQLLADMLPYIEESIREAYDLATVINDDGSIVI
jgi:hypothetical protein